MGPSLLRALPVVDGEHIELTASPTGADSQRTLSISPSTEGAASAAASPHRPARCPADDDGERASTPLASLDSVPPSDGGGCMAAGSGEPAGTSPAPSDSTPQGPSSNACFDAALPPVQLSLYRQQQEQQSTAAAEQLARRGRTLLPAPALARHRRRQKPRCEVEAPPSYSDGLRGRKLHRVPKSLHTVGDGSPPALATTAHPGPRSGGRAKGMRVFTALAASAHRYK